MTSTVTPVEEPKPIFGKYQSLIGLAYFQLIYVLWYAALGHMIYGVFFLDIPVVIFYLIVCVLQSKVKKSKKYVHFVNNIMQTRKGFKQFKLIYDEDIQEGQKCLFGFHPHGVLSTCLMAFMNLENSPMADLVGLCSRFMLHLPLVGLFLRMWGFQAVNHNNLKRLLRSGVNVGLVPGGFEEATLTVQDELRVYIKKRKGFIKYALENNYAIHPVLAVNEHKYFWTFRYFEQARLWLNKIKLPGVFYWSKQSALLLPFNLHYVAVVGKGIKGRVYHEGEKATKEQINKAHVEYIEEIKRMHAKHSELCQVPLKLY